MSNLLEELKNYFNNTPREEVLKTWESTKEFDKIGLSLNDFISQTETFLTTKLNLSLQLDETEIPYTTPLIIT